jgi:predicted deacylase
VRAYIGPDHGKRVYMVFAGVHGGEFEGMVGLVNFLSVLEAGRDLRGTEWPEITAAAQKLDRIIVVPILNVDGRTRVPLRMIRHRGKDHTVQEYFNTGGKTDGTLIGWPQCKQFIPLDFSKTQFPGGYPNDAGVNVQHDDFFGAPQPETRALFKLTAEERPDLILNMHTGASFLQPLRPFCEPVLTPIYEEMYRRVRTRLTEAGLQASDSAAVEADPKRERMSPYNLDTALNLHCGALAILVESPAHSFTRRRRDGSEYVHTPERLLDAHLICQQESMKLLIETGGRVAWTQKAPA